VTAICDVVAAYVVALVGSGKITDFDGRTVAILAGLSAGLYLFGMVENDLVDLRRDRLMHVPRPLVTGEIGLAGALALLVGAGTLAVLCALQLKGTAVLFAIGTFGAINLYNLGAKRGPAYVAMIVMGFCRVLNYAIGVAAAVGMPHNPADWNLLMPWGPLLVRHGLAIFFATAAITGYSIAARRKLVMSSRPWQVVAVVTFVIGLGTWVLMYTRLVAGFMPPLARVFAGVILAGLWPGRLWSGAGPQRTPEEYAPFIDRALYWMIFLDAAFVLDALLTRARIGF
jgi:4-hydroxybenzoate polyprenyltransferase